MAIKTSCLPQARKRVVTKMDIGKALVKRRKERGLKQGEVAQKAQIHQSTLSRIEQNQEAPGKQALLGLISALDITEPLASKLMLSCDYLPDPWKNALLQGLEKYGENFLNCLEKLIHD